MSRQFALIAAIMQPSMELTEALGPTVLEAKRVFPGATVSGIRKPEIDWEKGDDIPF